MLLKSKLRAFQNPPERESKYIVRYLRRIGKYQRLEISQIWRFLGDFTHFPTKEIEFHINNNKSALKRK